MLDKIRIIYEMANNHMGDVNHGIKIINELSKISSKYDFDFALKFQFRDLDTFIHPSFKGSDLKFVKRFEETKLSENDWKILLSETKKSGFKCITTPFDEISVKKALDLNIDILKIASCSMSDWPLIETIAKTNKEIIFSTAGSHLESIDDMVAFFQNRDKKFTVMHCVGKYPTPNNELQLGQISFFKNRYDNINIGYSTHENPNNFVAAGLALSLGATTFEKHVAIESDHFSINDYSATPKQIDNWLTSIENSFKMLGSSEIKAENSDEEVSSLRGLQRGAFAVRDIEEGEEIKIDDVIFAIPVEENGYTANDFSKYCKFNAKSKIPKLSAIKRSNVKSTNLRKDILEIVNKIKSLIEKSGIVIPNGQTMEISHHYGIEKFYENGLVMFTIVNEEYCKKILAMLPNQNHPKQFHKNKRETFHILKGEVDLILDKENYKLNVGDLITIEPNQVHEFSTQTGCIIEEISSNHQKDDSFYIDKKITDNKSRKTYVNFWR